MPDLVPFPEQAAFDGDVGAPHRAGSVACAACGVPGSVGALLDHRVDDAARRAARVGRGREEDVPGRGDEEEEACTAPPWRSEGEDAVGDARFQRSRKHGLRVYGRSNEERDGGGWQNSRDLASIAGTRTSSRRSEGK